MSARTEYALIGALLVDPQAFDEIAGIVQVEDFGERRAAIVYLAMWHLRCNGWPVDVVTLSDELDRTGELARIGAPFLWTVAASCPTSLHAGTYARMVARDGAERRGQPMRTAAVTVPLHERLGL